MKLYTCCPKEGCGAFQESLSLLKSYGIEPSIKADDDGHYFEFKISNKWRLNKIRSLNKALLKKVNVPEAECHICCSFTDRYDESGL